MNNNGENVLAPLPGNQPLSRNFTRVWRSPPQPHMCVQDTLKDTQITCFVNVMSWCKIGVPIQPSAPIPLYGGVSVPLSDKHFRDGQEKPLVFAVMVNPEILKHSGKMAPNPQDRDNLIDLMLDFVEAMNVDFKFSRKFTVLKDRDLTGELKDIWAVVQAKREAEKMNSTNNLSLPDENSQPCPQDLASPPQNTKHKRLGEGDTLSGSESGEGRES
ncbi:PIH1 domain-containing protein 2 isoform X2 [Macrosteles quadrilineatus]|nr:PIH1 domain-containing protein 2 isoform X2 [Macrosteles quadrilineatus]XP_054264298.1 PIH1 domain-containing protein 2 isoform X2 [Macrosteles quadrilineatus]XP_054264379.1 PIH1 domain-containing protein 2 isoform X2 [Macrosteles quadrilineatus]